MTLKELRKVLLGKYIHFTAEYRSEDTVWGGIVKKVESGGHLQLNTYFNDDFYPRTSHMATDRNELEELVSKGYLAELHIVYVQLLDHIPQIGEKTLIAIRFPIGFGFKKAIPFYTIGKNESNEEGNCAKCSFNNNFCAKWCKKYKCSYLESFYTNKNNSLFLRHLLR